MKQRLRLASVSPKLLDIYAADGMTLDQLMAFTVNGDHGRQEAVFERLSASYDKQPYTIRRMLTEGAVRASDKRAQFIGVEAYAQASGVILNDLFQGDDGGWLQDVALVEMMVAQKLQDEGGKIQAEGWKWIEVAPDFPYGHTYGLRQLLGRTDPLTDEEAAARAALQGEVDLIEETYAQAEELPDEADQRLGELEAALAGFDERPVSFEADDVGRAGAFVSIAPDGSLRVERGYVRPEDEQPIEAASEDYSGDDAASQSLTAQTEDLGGAGDGHAAIEPDEEDGLKPLSERLMTELTSYRTLGLRHALGEQPDVAFLAAVHALALKVFYIYGSDSCLELDLKSVQFGSQAPGLNDSAAAIAIATRHQSWRDALPRDSEALWDALQDFDSDSQQALFAHCVAQGVNAVHETWNRRPRALAHADRLAQAVDLDMVAEGWTPTIDGYLGRVTKARLLQAVAEAKGQRAADRIEHLKKGEMAEQAAVLLAGSGWLAEPLRNPGRAPDAAFNENAADQPEIAPVEEQSAADGGESAMEEAEASLEDEGVASGPHAIAAE